MRLEYIAAERPDGPWTVVQAAPAPSGRAEFQSTGAVVVRLQIQDLAENLGTASRSVPASGAAAGAAVAALGTPPPPSPVPVDLPPPAPTPDRVDRADGVSNWSPIQPEPHATNPPPPNNLSGAPLAVATKPGGTQAIAYSPNGAGPGPMPPPAPTPDLGAGKGVLPPLQIVNKKQVRLEFDVGKFGPSGLGGVDVYVTTDDGATWEKSIADPNVVLPQNTDPQAGVPVRGSVTVQLAKEAVSYGFCLVVKSRAGRGKPPPKNGLDLPQIRVELDATPPVAELYAPQPDPARHDTLVLCWNASDRNLASNPISLEWSAQRDGPWTFIGAAQLPNTGKYTWQVPPNIPPSVYLRLTVRDTADNSAVAQTNDPVLIDLSVPEVTNIGLGGVTLNPSH
jgi:hypothetical protein